LGWFEKDPNIKNNCSVTLKLLGNWKCKKEKEKKKHNIKEKKNRILISNYSALNLPLKDTKLKVIAPSLDGYVKKNNKIHSRPTNFFTFFYKTTQPQQASESCLLSPLFKRAALAAFSKISRTPALNLAEHSKYA